MRWVEPHGRGRGSLDRQNDRERKIIVWGFEWRQRFLADDLVKLDLEGETGHKAMHGKHPQMMHR